MAAVNGNPHHDTAHDAAFDPGFDALHVLAADEILMRREDAARVARDEENDRKAACLMSVIMAVTWRVTNVREIRDRLAIVAAMNAPEMLPREKLWAGRVEWQQARNALATCPEIVWHAEAGRVMIRLLTARGWCEREVGLSALCYVYAFQPDKSARPPLAASMESIGAAVGLTAENKRSAISAALKRTTLALMQSMQRRERTHAGAEFWFMKRTGCRAALRVAMRGKRNRAAKSE